MNKSKHYLSVMPAKPIGGLMDKRFVYVPAAQTNVAATFARIRAELGLPQLSKVN
jgi:hypothetical protein